MTKKVIEIQGLYKDYNTAAGVFPVLKDVNLTIDDGDYVAIMGPSGSGKSTFMNILGCLDRPTKGEYILDGHSVKSLSSNELAKLRNKTIGFVFQGFNLLARSTLVENVSLPLVYAEDQKELRNNKPEMIRVKTSITNGKYTEIVTSDIKPNEFVITADMTTDQKPAGSNAQGPNRPPRVF